MPYDPYGSQDPNAESNISFNPFSLAKDYLKWHFMMNPATWSGAKGMALPIGFSASKASWVAAGKEIGSNFKRGWHHGMGSIFEQGWGLRGHGEQRIGGWENWVTKTGRHGSEITKNAYTAFHKVELKAAIKKATQEAHENAINRLTKHFEAGAQAGKKKPLGKGAKNRIRNHAEETFKNLNGNEELLELSQGEVRATMSAMKGAIRGDTAAITRRMEGELSKKLWATIGTRTAMKWGFRAMKAVSIVGFASTAIDIGLMVGEPIGRVLMNQAANLMGRFQDRFMPHLGGHLNSGFLSYGAATERQRAVNAISKAYINGRSAYGQEAMYTHS